MPLKINNILNDLFYTSNNLICANNNKSDESIFWHHCQTPKRNTKNKELDNTNDVEINQIYNFVRKLQTEKYIIITPYRNQKKRFHHLQKDIKNVYTIDQAQGLEADYVIISLVRFTTSQFMNANRACVAFSRTKKELHIFGNYKFKKIHQNKFINKIHENSIVKCT